jgi:hypothetical protein
VTNALLRGHVAGAWFPQPDTCRAHCAALARPRNYRNAEESLEAGAQSHRPSRCIRSWRSAASHPLATKRQHVTAVITAVRLERRSKGVNDLRCWPVHYRFCGVSAEFAARARHTSSPGRSGRAPHGGPFASSPAGHGFLSCYRFFDPQPSMMDVVGRDTRAVLERAAWRLRSWDWSEAASALTLPAGMKLIWTGLCDAVRRMIEEGVLSADHPCPGAPMACSGERCRTRRHPAGRPKPQVSTPVISRSAAKSA